MNIQNSPLVQFLLNNCIKVKTKNIVINIELNTNSTFDKHVITERIDKMS